MGIPHDRIIWYFIKMWFSLLDYYLTKQKTEVQHLISLSDNKN